MNGDDPDNQHRRTAAWLGGSPRSSPSSPADVRIRPRPRRRRRRWPMLAVTALVVALLGGIVYAALSATISIAAPTGDAADPHVRITNGGMVFTVVGDSGCSLQWWGWARTPAPSGKLTYYSSLEVAPGEAVELPCWPVAKADMRKRFGRLTQSDPATPLKLEAIVHYRLRIGLLELWERTATARFAMP